MWISNFIWRPTECNSLVWRIKFFKKYLCIALHSVLIFHSVGNVFSSFRLFCFSTFSILYSSVHEKESVHVLATYHAIYANHILSSILHQLLIQNNSICTFSMFCQINCWESKAKTILFCFMQANLGKFFHHQHIWEIICSEERLFSHPWAILLAVLKDPF